MAKYVFLSFAINMWMNFSIVAGHKFYQLYFEPHVIEGFIATFLAAAALVIVLFCVTTLIHNLLVRAETGGKKQNEEKTE
jgi:hypothetical protein